MQIPLIIQIATFVLNIIILVGGIMAFIKVKFNDLWHLSKDVAEIKEIVSPLKDNFIDLKARFEEHCKQESK